MTKRPCSVILSSVESINYCYLPQFDWALEEVALANARKGVVG